MSTALADQPTAQMTDPMMAAVHAHDEPMAQAQASKVTMAMRLPGSTG